MVEPLGIRRLWVEAFICPWLMRNAAAVEEE
jgi:hypothetical protein